MTTTTSIRETGNLTGAIEDVTPMISDQSCERTARLLESSTVQPLDFYIYFHVDALEQLFATVYKIDAAKLINRIDARVVSAGMNALKTQEKKAVELYRLYSPTLRRIINRHSVNSDGAQALMCDMYLEQSRLDCDLEQPEWLDGYTKEVIEDEFADVSKACDKFLSDAGKKPVEITDLSALMTAADLHWDAKTYGQYLAAQTGFDAEADEETINDDDRGYTPSTLLSNEWVIDPNVWAHSDILKEFNRMRTIVFQIMKSQNVSAEEWQSEFEKRIAVDAAEFSWEIEELTHEFDAISIVALVYPIMGDYGIRPQHLKGIKVQMPAGDWVELNQAIDEIGDDLPINDSLKRIGETDPRNIDPHFLEDLKKTFDVKSKNPIETPEFNISKIEAITAGSTLEKANDLAWKAWKSRKQKIAAIAGNKSGLILDSGRNVTFQVAVMKLNAGELEITEDEKARLIKKLAELKISNDFTQTLAR